MGHILLVYFKQNIEMYTTFKPVENIFKFIILNCK